MRVDELQQILDDHRMWVTGQGGSRANLGGANLREANLGGANLYGANLREANLGRANLGRANLYGANLGGADLYEANLREANLGRANLCEANLRGANLYGANLREANLYGANLREANLGDVKWINARPLQLSGSQHTITALSPGRVLIGCHSKSIDQWLEHYKAIGRAENYSVDQVEEYGAHLRHVAAWLERAARLGWFERVD